jgi:hypothetical protein
MSNFISSIGELFLAILGASVHTTRTILGSVMRVALITALCIGGLFVQSSRLDLWSAPTSTFLTVAAAWATLWLSVVVLQWSPRLAGSVMTAMLIVIGVTTLKHLAQQGAPHTSAAIHKMTSYGDKKAERAANKAVLVHRKAIACDSTNWKRFDWAATDDENSQPVATTWYTEYDGRIWCFDGPGYDSLYFRPLFPVDSESIVRRIACQPPLEKPAAPVPEPVEPVWQAEERIAVPPPERPLL